MWSKYVWKKTASMLRNTGFSFLSLGPDDTAWQLSTQHYNVVVLSHQNWLKVCGRRCPGYMQTLYVDILISRESRKRLNKSGERLGPKTKVAHPESPTAQPWKLPLASSHSNRMVRSSLKAPGAKEREWKHVWSWPWAPESRNPWVRAETLEKGKGPGRFGDEPTCQRCSLLGQVISELNIRKMWRQEKETLAWGKEGARGSFGSFHRKSRSTC